jgi:hypothetical protein
MQSEKVETVARDEDRDLGVEKVVVDKNADIGLQFLTQHEPVEYTAAEERKVRWKIDLYLLPIVSNLEVLELCV